MRGIIKDIEKSEYTFKPPTSKRKEIPEENRDISNSKFAYASQLAEQVKANAIIAMTYWVIPQ